MASEIDLEDIPGPVAFAYVVRQPENQTIEEELPMVSILLWLQDGRWWIPEDGAEASQQTVNTLIPYLQEVPVIHQ